MIDLRELSERPVVCDEDEYGERARKFFPEHEPGCPALQAWDVPGACNCTQYEPEIASVAAEFAAVAAPLEARIAEIEAKYDLLKRAVNDSADDCTEECDSHGHREGCKTHSPAAWLEQQQARIAELERERAAAQDLANRHYAAMHSAIEARDAAQAQVAALHRMVGCLRTRLYESFCSHALSPHDSALMSASARMLVDTAAAAAAHDECMRSEGAATHSDSMDAERAGWAAQVKQARREALEQAAQACENMLAMATCGPGCPCRASVATCIQSIQALADTALLDAPQEKA